MRVLMIVGAALALASCGQMGPVSSAGTAVVGGAIDVAVPIKPADVADTTVLDEQIGIRATTAYTAASRLGARLVRAGLIDKERFKEADRRGFAAISLLRRTYLAGNAASYQAAIGQAYGATADIAALVK